MDRRGFPGGVSGLLPVAVAAFVLGGAPANVNADLIYVGDSAGNVGVFNTATNTGSFLGDLTGFSHGQNLGLAYRASTNDILILDRGNGQVFSMDAVSGTTSFLFNSPAGFQGGAVRGNLLYGSIEGTQRVEALDLSSGAPQGLTGPTFNHTHSMGINPATLQLYLWTSFDDSIHRINPDGTDGGVVVGVVPAEFISDIDYWRGDFLGTQFGARTIVRIDGVTGNISTLLNSAQLDAMGVIGNPDGVVVVIPGPAALSLLAVGGLLATRRRRK